MVKIKGINISLTATALALIAVIICASALQTSGDRFQSHPAHTVITKWYDSKQRRKTISGAEINKTITLHALPENRCDGKSIIMRVENLNVSVYTKGRFLYEEEEKGRAHVGTRTLIISADGLKRNSEIFVRLSPVKKAAGKVTTPIYLADNNDYLFTLLCREKLTIISSSAAFSGTAVFALCTVFALINRRKKYAFEVYLSALFLLSGIYILSKSEVMQFIIPQSAARYILHYASYMLIPLPLLAFSVSITKRCKAVSASQICVTAYALVRLLLYAAFSLPLDSGIFISHLILASAAAASAFVTAKKVVSFLRNNLFNV